MSGRDELTADIVARLTARRVTALVGPRRFGKTSLLRRVTAELAEGGAGIIWVDLYEATSTADIARRFDAGLAATTGPIRSALDSVAVSFDLQLGLLGMQLTRRKQDRPDADAVFDALLETLIAAGESAPTIVVIDEFPGIDRVEGAAGRLRTKFQHHFQEIGLVFAGSQPSLMRAMFAERSRPFYAQADLVEVGPFSAGAVDEIIRGGFRSTDRDAGDLPGRVFDFAAGHPYRTMQMADSAWRTVPIGKQVTPQHWTAALELLRRETHLACEAIFSGLRPSEQTTLRLLAHGDPLFGTIADTLALSSGSAQHAIDSLIDAGDVAETDGHRRVVDPILADWIRRRFPR
ncbi:MAG TPA: ATP-binding protein [Acidimicrobiales bacterium]|nr:ATP-binding protein [Acidimicrobiales bacterium]